MIGKHLGDVRPVSTGIITTAFARPDILFELDVTIVRAAIDAPHRAIRPYHSSAARYGHQGQQLDCEFCMAVVAGDRVILRGQTGMGLDEKLTASETQKPKPNGRWTNVETLLAETGARMADVVKATIYVTDRAFLGDVNEDCAASTRRRCAGLHLCYRERPSQPGAPNGGRHRRDQG